MQISDPDVLVLYPHHSFLVSHNPILPTHFTGISQDVVLILRLKRNCLQLRDGIRVNAEQRIDPLQDNEERLWLAHVLTVRNKTG
jgi:hypothetical protein